MNIYEHTTSMTTQGGTQATTTLGIRGGLLRQVLVRAATDTTQFQVEIKNERSINILDFGFHVGEVNDCDLTVPVCGEYTLTITNASPNDTFDVQLSVEE